MMTSPSAPVRTRIDPRSPGRPRDADADRPTAAVEAYVTATLELEPANGGLISGGALAARVGVSEPSVASMLTRLAALGLVDRAPRRGVRLTAGGRRVAMSALRRQRVLEAFLVTSAGVPWDEARAEAEHLRHAISDGLTERIWTSLGEPRRDPHGDPIPSADGTTPASRADRALLELLPGEAGRIVRVSDAEPAMLRHLTARGIRLGSRLEVLRREPFNGGVAVRVCERLEIFGLELANSIWIEAVAGR
jgi:DtxR family Mn-dependent transcriptional regulator